MPHILPKAKVIAVAGQYAMAAEPLRAGRATACIVGDTEAFALARRNSEWAVVLDPQNLIDKRPNSWMIRYGDTSWKNFLDSWCSYISGSGELKRIYDRYAESTL